MHFICCMTPQPNQKILKLLQVQTSIHSFLCNKVCQKQSSGWSIAGNLGQCARYHRILEQNSKINTNSDNAKVLTMLRKQLLILCQRQKYHALVLSVSLSNLTWKNFRQTSQWYPLFTPSLKVSKKPTFYRVKSDVLNKYKTSLEMASIDLDMKKNLSPLSNVNWVLQ